MDKEATIKPQLGRLLGCIFLGEQPGETGAEGGMFPGTKTRMGGGFGGVAHTIGAPLEAGEVGDDRLFTRSELQVCLPALAYTCILC